MSCSIDYYKETFTDVKIIYNIDEKIKRYKVCENNHKTLMEELECIDKKVEELSEEKKAIIEAYKNIDREFMLTLKAAGGKLITSTKIFVGNFCSMQQIVISYFAEKKFALE
jgi:hypothetical protein